MSLGVALVASIVALAEPPATGVGNAAFAPPLGELTVPQETEATVLPPVRRRVPGAKLEEESDRSDRTDLEDMFDIPSSPEARAHRLSKLAMPTPMSPRDSGDIEALAELERLYARYRRASNDVSRSVEVLMVIEAATGREKLQTAYDERIARHRARAVELRADAIARYEDFLSRHPDDQHWTPEILFRLAELHYHDERDRFERAEEGWQKALAKSQSEESDSDEPELPPAPIPKHEASIRHFSRIVAAFPAYAHADAALYMRGFLLYQVEEFEKSRQAFLNLVCADRFRVGDAAGSVEYRAGAYRDCRPFRTASVFVPEAWMRIGEGHYDDDELDAALAAFEHAARDHEASVYSAALLRVGLTHYLRASFAAASTRLDEFVRFVDAQPPERRDAKASESRELALSYIAKSYAQEDWDLDGRPDDRWGVDRLDRDYAQRTAERHVPEIYVALGELLAEQTEFVKAIELWELALERWPTAARAPRTQAMVYEAYLLLQESEKALAARDRLATEYLRQGAWFRANENDADAIEAALEHSEKALVATAEDHHVRAQQLRAAGDPAAREEYQIAAKAYEAFLDRFPNSPNAYQYQFQLGESYFYSDRFFEAARVYAAVRDSNHDNRLQLEAAEGVVLALEAYVQGEEVAGRMRLPEMPKAGSGLPMNAIEIPPLIAQLQLAYDEFVTLRPDADTVPAMRLGAAEISQKYRHFDDSRSRYEEIVERHCGSNAAIRAGYGLIDAHVIAEDLEGARKWTSKLSELGCGEGDEVAKFAGELETIENAVRFQEAERLFAAGKFEAAADRYVALVDQAPDDPQADKALNNAAAAYERIGRFSSATRAYQRIYSKYEDSEFADDALLRTGYNYARFFQFEEALAAYRRLAESERYAQSPHRNVALLNSAALLDSLHRYERASVLFDRYAKQIEDPNEQIDVRFRSTKVLAKLGQPRRTIAAYEGFLREFGEVEGHDDKILEAWLQIGLTHHERRSKAKAIAAFERCISEFQRRQTPAATDAADYPAQAQFILAEYRLSKMSDIKLRGRGKKLGKAGERLLAQFQEATRDYGLVFPYRRVEWILAAIYRQGHLWETLANRYRDAPVPRELRRESEAYYAYLDIVDSKVVQPAEAKAVELFRETVKYGRDYKVRNEWTQRAMERLNVYLPAEFPLLREPALLFRLER